MFQDDNTYATIQHPNRRGSMHMATLSIADDMADYATLSGVPHHSMSTNSSLRGAPNVRSYTTSVDFFFQQNVLFVVL